MRRARQLLGCLAIATGLWGCKGPRAPELEQVCVIASEVRKDASLDVAGHAEQLARRVAADIPSPEFTELWASLNALDVDSRYDRLMVVAAEQNMHGWTCLTLRQLWKELGEHQRLAAWDAAHPPGDQAASADEPAASKGDRKGEARRKGKGNKNKGKRRKGKRRR